MIIYLNIIDEATYEKRNLYLFLFLPSVPWILLQ